jgi:hypothetical protein
MQSGHDLFAIRLTVDQSRLAADIAIETAGRAGRGP